MSEAPRFCFLAHFSALRDPRQAVKVLYPLPEIVLLLLCATLAGADDFVGIALWGEDHLAFLRRWHPYKRGIPSHDTLCDVIAAIDHEHFKACFAAWVKDWRDDGPEHIAIDGKTSRRSHDRARGRSPLHTVSAWASRQRLVLGQEAVAEKSNEITAIPLLLQRLDLNGALVTIDAMGTQVAIAQAIVDGGGEYVLSLKENWPATYAEVAAVFTDPAPAVVIHRAPETVEGDHGRIETRRHAICHEVDWLFSQRRYPGAFHFPGLAAIGMIERETERRGAVERETSYYLCSGKFDVDTFARAVRAHWSVENNLHWVLDRVFDDDQARSRTDHGPANMAVIKHAALNFLGQARDKLSMRKRRQKAAWNQEYLLKIIRRAA